LKIDVNLKKSVDDSYKIEIGDELEKIEIKGKVGIVTNPKVAGLHLKELLSKLEADEVHIITVPDGEEFKSLKSVNSILESLFIHQFDRKSTLIGFGGGVVGDITGFTASIFQRGINFIQVPTTLLSQVDSSVGGKTGVNSRFGKNLIGSFYQPKAVFINTSFLKTLPEREISAGIAEIIKMAIIFDDEFLLWLEEHDVRKSSKNLLYAIRQSIELKAWVVSKDEKEKGLRASLNYGHTFGHVIENEGNYTRYLHGEAVSMGIVMANKLAVEIGDLSQGAFARVVSLLKKYGLPTKYEIQDIETFYDKFFLDKKSSGGKIKFVLPNGIGKFKFHDDIGEETIKKVLEKFI
jgi:3-dehydroquinate synthase